MRKGMSRDGDRDPGGDGIKNFNFSEQTVSITQGVTYAKGHTIIGDPKTPAGKRKMLILPGLLETLELSQSELNDPEAYVLPSLNDPMTRIPHSLSKPTGGFGNM